MEFCPDSAAWGDVATWVAGLATLLAVWVALRASRQAADIALRIRDDEKRIEALKEESLRNQLIAALCAELSIQTFVFRRLREQFQYECGPHGNLGLARKMLDEGVPKRGFTMLSRFAEKLEVFPISISAPLLALLTRVELVREAPSHGDLSFDELQAVAVDFNRTLSTLIDDMEKIRKQLNAIAPSEMHIAD